MEDLVNSLMRCEPKDRYAAILEVVGSEGIQIEGIVTKSDPGFIDGHNRARFTLNCEVEGHSTFDMHDSNLPLVGFRTRGIAVRDGVGNVPRIAYLEMYVDSGRYLYDHEDPVTIARTITANR